MSRPIKYRFWTGEKMIYGGLIEAADGSVWENTVVGYPGDFNDKLEKRDWVPLQWTGLKDKNGREIYEGDLISGGSKHPQLWEVVWRDDHPGFFCKKLKGDESTRIGHHFEVLDFYEVIGNIYENPDLIREGVSND